MGKIVAREVADNIAPDVALECLVKVQSGRRHVAASDSSAFARRVVRRRAVDWLRRSQHSGERNTEHARELEESAHAWMSPELALEERELNELHEQTLGALPDACRRTYPMVREEGAELRCAPRTGSLSPHNGELFLSRVHPRYCDQIRRWFEGLAESQT